VGSAEASAAVDERKVCVVFGERNERAHRAMFDFLRSIGLHPTEWVDAIEATGRSAPSIMEILDRMFDLVRAVVVLMTPDDEARLRSPFVKTRDPPHERELTPQARPNVIFEAGWAFGRYPDHTVLVELVELGPLRPVSDLAGLHVVQLDNSEQKRRELARKLRAAGCPVDLDGSEWQTAGDFELPRVTATLNVTVPDTTGAVGRPVCIAGNLDRLEGDYWDPGSRPLRQIDETHWTIQLAGRDTTRVEYKFALGSWEFVERGASCEERENRELILRDEPGGMQVDVVVHNWRNVPPCGD
jgi:predicted nucleotide-binding protein